MTARLLMIGLDGADETMIDEGSADGSLPNLAALRKRGAGKPLKAPASASDDALWASFHFGVPLGEHGRDFYLRRRRHGRWSMALEDELEADTFWHVLSNEGLDVAVIDAAKCAPPKAFGGIHVVDWLTHGKYMAAPASHPPELAGQLVERFGAAPPSPCGGVHAFDAAQAAELAQTLARATAMKRDAALHLLDQRDWDLFFVGFKEAHCSGHALWDLRGGEDDPVKAVLAGIDAAIGALVAKAGPQAQVVVFATTRMEANSSVGHLEKQIVRRLNRDLGETWLKQKARGAWRKLTGTQYPPPVEAAPFNESMTVLRLRRKRDIETVSERLFELRDGDGEPIVTAIDRPSSTETGAKAHTLADLVVLLKPGVSPRAVSAPWLGRIEAEPEPLRTGNHAAGGFVIGTLGLDRVGGLEDMAALARASLT